MTKTTNYNLNQWEAEDVIKREDFNADNAAIDAALAAVAGGAAKIAWGTYVGTGGFGSNKPNSIELGFEAKLVLISRSDYTSFFYRSTYDMFALFIRPVSKIQIRVDSGNPWYSWPVWSGGNTFIWYGENDDTQFNVQGRTYAYVAIG